MRRGKGGGERKSSAKKKRDYFRGEKVSASTLEQETEPTALKAGKRATRPPEATYSRRSGGGKP